MARIRNAYNYFFSYGLVAIALLLAQGIVGAYMAYTAVAQGM